MSIDYTRGCRISWRSWGSKSGSVAPASMLLGIVRILPSSLVPLKPELAGYFNKNQFKVL